MRRAPNYCVDLRQARYGAASLGEAKRLLQSFVDAHACAQELELVLAGRNLELRRIRPERHLVEP